MTKSLNKVQAAAVLVAGVLVCTQVRALLPNGVSAGDVTQTSAVLWTHSTGSSGSIEYSTDPSFSSGVTSIPFTVSDSTLPVKFNVNGLSAGSQYYYRANDGTEASTGSFRTPAASGKNGFRFGVTGDWRGELAPYPAIANLPARNLELLVKLGDTIYSDVPSPDVPAAQAMSLSEYRAKYNEVYGPRYGSNTWRAANQSTAVLTMLDDHEVTNDFQGYGTVTASDSALYGSPAGTRVNDSALYNTGVQAFQEYHPINNQTYAGPDDTTRMSGETKLYRSQSYGRDAAVMVLDARSFRDPGLPGVTNPADPAQVGGYLAQSFNPARTMLGGQQLSDLKSDLLNAKNSGTTWKFVNIPEPIQNLGVLAASDRFEGYAAERTELLKFIKDNQIDNVVFVTADIHGTLVNNLTYQTGPGQPQIATNAFEISTGAVAYDAPFGPTVIGLGAALGAVTPAQLAFYNSLPVANDADSALNDKDDFVKSVLNAQITPLGYDPIGLNNNLPQANGLIDATLLQGDYLSTHTYGWTEFDIDPLTQALLVTTYGIPGYTKAELDANPSLITGLTPQIVSQFRVAAVPEPTSLGLAAIASAMLIRRRR